MSISDLLTGYKILEKIDSPVNGKIEVIRSLAWGTYIQAAGLTQSGGVLKDVWQTTLKKVKRNKKIEFKNCLILGLGAGSVAHLVKKYWPEVKVTAVELDPIMVRLGKKYLDLDQISLKINIQDAESFLQKNSVKKKYDLIINDIYTGDKIPEKFEKREYLKLIKKNLSSSGIVIFNRLYYDLKRREAMKFYAKLEKEFLQIDVVYPEANVMFVCKK